MPLSGLPREGVLEITETLFAKDLNSLLRNSYSMANLLLLSFHALEIDDKDGLPALISGTGLLASLLSRGTSPNYKDPMGMTTPQLDWGNRPYEATTSQGAQMNTPEDQFRMTPLIWAANMEYPSTSDLLVCAGEDVFANDHPGEAILHWAAKRGFRGPVWQLIEEAGTNVDIRENYGNTPLHCAGFFGKEDTVQLLLRACTNPNARNKVGMTALHWAAGHPDGFAGIIYCLLEHTADPGIPDDSGRKAAYRAWMYENVSPIMPLQERTRDSGGTRQCA